MKRRFSFASATCTLTYTKDYQMQDYKKHVRIFYMICFLSIVILSLKKTGASSI